MKKIKRFAVLCCVLSWVFLLSACGQKKEEGVGYEYSEASLVTQIAQDVEVIMGLSDEELDEVIEKNKIYESQKLFVTSLESYRTAKKEAGGITGIRRDEMDLIDYTLATDDQDIIITFWLEGKERDVKVMYTFGIVGDNLGTKNVTYEAQYTMKENLINAGANTLLGITSVILVLAFLMMIISLFKYVNMLEKKIADKKAEKDMPDNTNTFAQLIEKEEAESDEEDDSELVAVITAAIAAMEQTSTDGFVVRSIRRVPQSKWKRG